MPYTLDTSEFVWDVYEFNSEHKTPEKVEVDWQRGIVTELGKDDEKAEENSGLSAVIPNSAPASAEEEPKPSKAEAKAPSLDAIKEQIKAEEEKIREVRAAAEKLHQEEMLKKRRSLTSNLFRQQKKSTNIYISLKKKKRMRSSSA